MISSPTTLRGVLHLWTETGTEGGYWSFQDERFITPNTTRFSCRKCGACWDKTSHPAVPPVDDPASGHRTLFGDSYCAPGAHDFQLTCAEDWSYEGLHVLKDGDKLVIFDKTDPSRVLWSGTISLRQYPLFTEDASGYWIHATQKGIDRQQWAGWFLREYPAELTPAPDTTP
ncbi:MAG: hypothetical protein WCT10_02540 [Patescibacteria group bacterium]|jgi:hypothetical protein